MDPESHTREGKKNSILEVFLSSFGFSNTRHGWMQASHRGFGDQIRPCTHSCIKGTLVTQFDSDLVSVS